MFFHHYPILFFFCNIFLSLHDLYLFPSCFSITTRFCSFSVIFSCLFMIFCLFPSSFSPPPRFCSCPVIFSCHFMFFVFSHHVFPSPPNLVLSCNILQSLYYFCRFQSYFSVNPWFCSCPVKFSFHFMIFVFSHHVPESLPILFQSSNTFLSIHNFCLFHHVFPGNCPILFLSCNIFLSLHVFIFSHFFRSAILSWFYSRFMLQTPWAVSRRYLQQTPLSHMTAGTATYTPELYVT